ncbi:MAG: choice-of-anchor J domain-containing protein, partial [Muribaculaceae bacterium]|nr:choice-of-anchor J domain-containing protein [Muribaculaceae bacterium]
NEFLKGFESGVDYENSVTGTYTLTTEDYEAISKLMQDKAQTDEEKAEAKAIASNCFFNKDGNFPASVALPPFLETAAFPYYLASNGSTADISYAEAANVPEILSAIGRATQYTVSKDDYKDAWGSEDDYIAAFAPMTPAANYLPEILKAKIADATEGQYAIVNYSDATDNPIFSQVGGGPLNYSEPFTASQGDFVTYDAVLPEGLTYVWSWAGENYGMKASAFANKTNYAAESWLISPIFTLEGSKASFSFEEATNYFTDVETAKKEASVWVRPLGGEWEQMSGYTFPEKMGWDFVSSGDIDLSKYCGSSVQIGFKYTSDTKAGTWEIKNFVLTSEEGSVGDNPGFIQKSMKKAPVNTPVLTTKNAVYYYNGSDWSIASGVVALNPADYAAMGVDNAKLTAPETMIPLYLKNNLIYAQDGDEMIVVYNNNKTALFVYDGAKWALNNNGLENVVGKYTKKGDAWSFTKYVGKATFDLFNEDQITLDRNYLFVAGNICGTVIPSSDTYGYINAYNVSIADGTIVIPTDAYAYTFASSATVEDVKYNVPEGTFLMKDSNNRYLYMRGTYTSFNVQANPNIEDGSIAKSFLWTASKDADGNWTIKNVDNGKTWAYSTKYTSFGAYDSLSAVDVLPVLYMMRE